ncbi:MAG: hypothetical protein JSR46_01740 [Verrucomicrobia bacterium]|nr:hypothetical protein [Verrucomicrobiota bacterium]
MRKQQAKTANQTFSLPLEVLHDLNALIRPRERSRFVSDLLRDALEIKKQKLRQAYSDANTDEGQVEAMSDWETTIADGFDDW